MKQCQFVLLALCCLAVGVGFPCGMAQADTITWNTTAGDWHTAGSWSPAQIPTTGDDVLITGAGASVLLTNSTAALGSLVLSKTLMFTNWNTTLTASNVTVQSGGVITLPAAFTNNQMSNNVTIVCTNLTIDAGGSINVDSNGYAGGGNSGKNGNGPGAGLVDQYCGGGGGHGGRGGNGYQWIGLIGFGGIDYGVANAPVDPGSGGGWGEGAPYPGGAGGGAVRIRASGLVEVDGTITACGASTLRYGGGGGSGGSIYITCRTFSGNNGVVKANGGSWYGGPSGGGGGAGGRIAVIYDTSAQASAPAVQFSALPGVGWRDGVLGTIYFSGTHLLSETPNVNGRILGISAWSPNNLTLNNVWIRFPEDGFQLTVTNNLIVDGSSAKLDLGGNTILTNYPVLWAGVYPAYYAYQWNRLAHSSEMANRPAIGVGGNLILTNGGSLTVFATMTNATVANYGAFVGVTGTLFVAANSYVYPYSQPTNGGSVLFRVGNLVVSAPNAGFNADEKGYFGAPIPASGVNGYGPGGGSGLTYYGGGGGYGGFGGYGYYQGSSLRGGANGDASAPAGPGSGGGGSGGQTAGVTLPGCTGGGMVWIEATNAITLDGTITACGGSGMGPGQITYGAGGSGGGVLLRCKTISGTGVVTANGGVGYNGGVSVGGGGGGGGRIAVVCDTNAQTSAPDLQYSAMPGTGWRDGSLGTIYCNGARLLPETLRNINGMVMTGFSPWSPGNLTVSNAWVRFASDGFQLVVSHDLTIGASGKLEMGGNMFATNYQIGPSLSGYYASELTNAPALSVGGNMLLTDGGSLSVFATLTNASLPNYGALVSVAGNLTIADGSWIYPYSHPTNGGTPSFTLGSLTIASSANAGINADDKGYLGVYFNGVAWQPGYGPGCGLSGPAYGGGGGYGGVGGNGMWLGTPSLGGGTYGNSNAPVAAGSGGGGTAGGSLVGGRGGGAVRLQVAGQVSHNGVITACGLDGVAGLAPGGAGGSIYLTCKNLTGSTGVLKANGGNGYNPLDGNGCGGGGGGRIAIWRQSDAFSGPISVTNGTGTSYGSLGTIVWIMVPPPGTVMTIR